MVRSPTFWLFWFVGIIIAFNVPYLAPLMHGFVRLLSHITGVAGAMAILAFLPLIGMLAMSLGRRNKVITTT